MTCTAIAILIPLIWSYVLMTSAYALPTEGEVKTAVAEILQERAATVHTPGAEMTFQSPICYLVAQQLAEKLRAKGLHPFLNLNQQHMNVGIYATDLDGNDVELVIDPTFRQFFVGDNDSKLMERMFREFNVPFILVVSRKELKATLEGFAIKPNFRIYNFEHFFGRIRKLNLTAW